jgi:hypothetical protein
MLRVAECLVLDCLAKIVLKYTALVTTSTANDNIA